MNIVKSVGSVFKKGISSIGSMFSKDKSNNNNLLSKGCLNVHDGIKNTYQSQDKQEKFGKDCGYEYDKELSNHNNQVYFNPTNKNLIYSVAGTHNMADVGTDLKMMSSGIKSTDRYKEAQITLGKAKAKYSPSTTTGIGHSLGGAIISDLGGIDKKITMNKASVNPFKGTPGNEIHVRTYGDAVSFLSTRNKHTHNIIGGNISDPMSWLKAHNSSNVKKYNYKIPDS
jgi:hypothetical protein